MQIANEFRVPVHAVSGGKNWGYGAKVPMTDGAVLLDLGRLNRIVDFHEDMAYVVIEAGVTQAQLRDHLVGAGGRLWLDANASSPHSTLVGNLLARGFGGTVYGDHVSAAGGFEVVLADGSIVHTGYGAFAGSRMADLDRWGPGPMLDGLFSQSNFGVVTKAALWLMPAAEHTEVVMFEMDDLQQVAACTDAVRGWRVDGTVRGTYWIGNHCRVFTGLQQFPWDQHEPPLTEADSVALARRYGIARWTGFVPLYGSRARVAVDRRRVRATLRALARRVLVADARILDTTDPAPRVQLAMAMFDAFTGGVFPGLRRAYWRKRDPIPADPDPRSRRRRFHLLHRGHASARRRRGRGRRAGVGHRPTRLRTGHQLHRHTRPDHAAVGVGRLRPRHSG
jgi:4-cresol dehydrogenase (hydroxylating)